MKKVLVFCLFTCSLQVIAGVDRNFVGEGTWSDSAGNSGVVTSHLHLGWLSGIKLDYRVKLNGDEVLHSQMIVQPHSDDSCNLLTLEKKEAGIMPSGRRNRWADSFLYTGRRQNRANLCNEL